MKLSYNQNVFLSFHGLTKIFRITQQASVRQSEIGILKKTLFKGSEKKRVLEAQINKTRYLNLFFEKSINVCGHKVEKKKKRESI